MYCQQPYLCIFAQISTYNKTALYKGLCIGSISKTKTQYLTKILSLIFQKENQSSWLENYQLHVIEQISLSRVLAFNIKSLKLNLSHQNQAHVFYIGTF